MKTRVRRVHSCIHSWTNWLFTQCLGWLLVRKILSLSATSTELYNIYITIYLTIYIYITIYYIDQWLHPEGKRARWWYNNNNINTRFILPWIGQEAILAKARSYHGLSMVGIVKFWATLFWWETVGFLPGWKLPIYNFIYCILCASRYFGLNPRRTALCGIASSANASSHLAMEYLNCWRWW